MGTAVSSQESQQRRPHRVNRCLGSLLAIAVCLTLATCGGDENPTGPQNPGPGGGSSGETKKFNLSYCDYANGSYVYDNPSAAMAQQVCVSLGYDRATTYTTAYTTCGIFTSTFLTSVTCYRD